MTAADTTGRIRHLLDVMHKTTDENGDPIPVGFIPMTDGLGQVEYIDSATIGGAGTLAALTDVSLTSPAVADRLRFNGTVWENSALTWKNVMVLDPTSGNYLPVTTGAGEPVYTETL